MTADVDQSPRHAGICPPRPRRSGSADGAAPAPSLKAGLFLAALLALGAAGATHPRPQTELERIFYDIGVIGYCGLSSEAVLEGFRRQLKDMVERDGIGPARVREARSRAMTMVEMEWDNRGLGGFRGWCLGEGEGAVERFVD